MLGHELDQLPDYLGYTGEAASKAAQDNGIDLQIVKLPEAKKGFVLPPPPLGSGEELWLAGEIT